MDANVCYRVADRLRKRSYENRPFTCMNFFTPNNILTFHDAQELLQYCKDVAGAESKSTPMEGIGIFIAVISLTCAILMLADLFYGLRNVRLWFHGRFLAINGGILSLIPFAMMLSGLFHFGDSYLVAGTDGVGTKLKLAFETGIHDTIGIDLAAMSVNDIITSGAKPLFFLDYYATSHLDVDLAEKVLKGIVDGCKQSNCALLGGETAEMPDFYANGEYDLSGFAVGVVKKDSVINGKNISVGDVLIGLPSGGVHSNGFSLVRRVLARSGLSLKDQLPGESVTLAEALMAPTVIYVKQVLDIISKGGIKGIAHITGGGFTDNIPRVFPEGLGALVYKNSWPVPPVFKWIQKAGNFEETEMMQTFNMGIGMVLVS